jgi:hypothetical protein
MMMMKLFQTLILYHSSLSSHCADPMSQKPSSWWKQKPKTDPILLLAAAAKAIDQDEQLLESKSDDPWH